MQGLLLFYKPVNWRNKDILKFFQASFGRDIKVGHSGTLDPFAEGLMVMGLGRKFTRQLHDLLLHSQKEYVAKMKLGKISDTYDIEGNITEYGGMESAQKDAEKIPTIEEIKKTIEVNFFGEQSQIPPIHSAKKHKGKRLRDIKDKSEAEKIAKTKVKKVTLFDFEIISYEYPILEIRLLVSSGFYIRSFGNSLGEKLGVGAYLTNLQRTKLGDFSVINALTPENFQSLLEIQGKISGEVQGVGFRYFTEEITKKLSLKGYVKNLADGTVEFLSQGYLNSLSGFQNEILKGPESAEISDYEFIISKPNKIYNNFEILT